MSMCFKCASGLASALLLIGSLPIKRRMFGFAHGTCPSGRAAKIQRLQQADGVGEVGVQRGVACGVGDGVGNHVLKER